MDADHFFHQIRRTIDVRAPAGHRHVPLCIGAEAQRAQDFALAVGGNRHATQALGQGGVISHDLRPGWRRARLDHFARLTAADLDDQLGQDRKAGIEEGRIDPAFKPGAGIGGQIEGAAGLANPDRIEIGHFQQHVGRLVRTARMLATHDPGDVMYARLIGDHGHRRSQRVFLAVERQHLLAILGAAGEDCAAQLGQVISVGRAAIGQHDIVGNVDQRRDRPLTGAQQPVLHPLRRGTVLYPADRAAKEGRAAIGIVGADRQRAGEAARHGLHRNRLQRAKAGGGQIAGDPINAHAVRTVGRDRHVEHRIRAVIIGEIGADRRIGRQLDDPVVIVTQLQFAGGAHHAVAFDPADRALFQLEPAGGNDRTGKAQHADQTRAGIGRAANDLQRIAIAGIDREDLQLVGIGVALGGQHLGDLEPGELGGGILDPFHFKPHGVELGRNLLNRSRGVEVVLKPGKRELHRAALLKPQCRRRPTGSARHWG